MRKENLKRAGNWSKRLERSRGGWVVVFGRGDKRKGKSSNTENADTLSAVYTCQDGIDPRHP
jgi:hypothetical protein